MQKKHIRKDFAIDEYDNEYDVRTTAEEEYEDYLYAQMMADRYRRYDGGCYDYSEWNDPCYQPHLAHFIAGEFEYYSTGVMI